jgi:hypothetical protein
MHRCKIVVAPLLVLALPLAGCMENRVVTGNNTNLPPEANAGPDQEVDYDGEPVRVTLDGTASSDRDGRVVAYRWESTAGGPDGGRLEGAPDPDDEAAPELELEAGVHGFNLWVTDDQGAVSAPDQVTVLVGVSAAGECVDDISPLVPQQCASCICEMSAECAEAALACSDDCWNLILCIATDCGGNTDDTGCIVSACAAYLGGVDQATAVGGCIPDCIDVCDPGGAAGGDAGM